MPYFEIPVVTVLPLVQFSYQQAANDARYRYLSPCNRRRQELEDLRYLLSHCDENASIFADGRLFPALSAQA